MAQAITDSQPPAKACRSRWNCRPRWLIALIVVGLILALHRPLLTGLARGLVVEQSWPHADWVLIDEGHGRIHQAAVLMQSGGADGVLIVEPVAYRSARLKILPTPLEIERSSLMRRGIPEQAITVIPGGSRNIWQSARLLGNWLQEHPDDRILLLCDRYSSRNQRYVLDTILSAEAASRVAVYGLPDYRFDETEWWWSRGGIKTIFGRYAKLIFDRLAGETPAVGADWDPDAYGRSLRARQP